MTVFFRPCGDLTQAPAPRTNRDLDLYAFLTEHTGLTIAPAEGRFVDYEDWMEPAKMLEAAINAGLEILVLSRTHLRQAVVNPLAHIEGKPCRDMLIGRSLESDPFELKYFDLGWPVHNNNLANHYPELNSFRRNAGRKVEIADMPGEPSPISQKYHFTSALASVSLAAALKPFEGQDTLIKQVYPAKALPLIHAKPKKGMTDDQREGLFIRKVGFHFARYEGDRASLLVQEKVTMTHETRFFVVNGEVVCGAACIEAHTPQINETGEMLLADFEIYRNQGCFTTDHKAMATLLGFAQSVAREITEEAPELQNFVLDVALGNDRQPLVIELNPIAESGLYGICANRLFSAIQMAAENEPHHTPKEWDRSEFEGLEGPKNETWQAPDAILFDDDIVDGDFFDTLEFDPEEIVDGNMPDTLTLDDDRVVSAPDTLFED